MRRRSEAETRTRVEAPTEDVIDIGGRVRTGDVERRAVIVLAVLGGAVILGGIRRIGAVAEKLVPAMVVLYFICVAIILGTFSDQITDTKRPPAIPERFMGA